MSGSRSIPILPSALKNYRVRESPRAKHVSLRLSAQGLEVVLPVGYDRSKVPEILQQKHRWIEKTYGNLIEDANSAAQQRNTLPDRLTLQALQQEWIILYHPSSASSVRLRPSQNHTLNLYGATHNIVLCQDILEQWLTSQAQQQLIPWLKQLSQTCQLPVREVRIRRQKTLWGSCSARKNISLNLKLLFLPAPIVRYVFIHELCHTIYMNHSAQFWALVETHEPHYRRLRQELKQLKGVVPAWLEMP